jgi:hypothetical protein
MIECGTVNQRSLSKSDFKLARSCEAKLYFREHGYPDNRRDDPFLRHLAEGGYMVEALAKAHYPEGIECDDALSMDNAWEATRLALLGDDVTLFEATLVLGRCMARVDILQKRGDTLRLIEVKAASVDHQAHKADLASGGPGEFRQRRKPREIVAAYRSYLEDVTLQTILLERLFPGHVVEPYLMLVDSSATAARDGVLDLFDPVHALPSGKLRAPRFRGTAADLRDLSLLAEVSVATEVEILRPEVSQAMDRYAGLLDAPFGEFKGNHDHTCRDCEFRLKGSTQIDQKEVRDGFRECWGDLAATHPHVLDLYSIGTLKDERGDSLAGSLKQLGRASLFDIPEKLLVKKDGTMGVRNARQLRQLHHTRSGDVYIGPSLRDRLEAIRSPIHFIDFEASRVALPYHAGLNPYSLLAFQWSCHRVSPTDDKPIHSDWLNVSRDWPSGEFVRSLRQEVGDVGSLVVWSSFEKSTLRELRRQLAQRGELTSDLVDWFDGLDGRIVDLMKIAEEDYYHPAMGGRVSIKVVLDALWQTDPRLREQCAQWFSQPILAEHDPYKALPPLQIGDSLKSVHDGMGAIRAYEMMQFTEAANDAQTVVQWSRLLRQYCELDTLSMVLIHEHWRRCTGLA